MDTASQWPQNIMEEIGTPPSSMERKARPHKEQALNCPRCNSTNTKFCYYNNYSLSQPRYFCKTCRRYWTHGGSLRTIPVGGGSRKNKRSSSYNNNHSSSSTSTSSNSSSSKKLQQNPKNLNNNDNLLRSQDLNLGFSVHRDNNNHAELNAITEMIQAPSFELGLQNPNSSAMEILTAGLSATTSSSRGFNNYAFMPVNIGPGFPNLAEFNKTGSLNFSLDHGLGGNYGGFENNGNNSSKLLFPFEDLKQDHNDHSSNANDGEQDGDNRNEDPSNGYWNGVIGGGSW